MPAHFLGGLSCDGFARFSAGRVEFRSTLSASGCQSAAIFSQRREPRCGSQQSLQASSPSSSNEERTDALDLLAETPARSLDGMQAKAATLKRRQVEEDPGATGAIAASLADDVLKLTGRTAQA